MSLYEIIERNLYFTELSSTEIIGIICASEFVVRLFKVEAKLDTVQLPLLHVNLKQSSPLPKHVSTLLSLKYHGPCNFSISVESNAINADQTSFA